ncbi:MAG: holo-ACP synthase [Rhodospirillales bacterium]
MIIGIGNDLISITRIKNTLDRYGNKFIHRIFTELEQKTSDKRLMRAASYAKRYAAKEACSKALGTGFRGGVFWRDMGVINLPSGKPTMKLACGALQRLEELIPVGMEAQIDLTITDELPTAEAFVIISAIPTQHV